MADKNKAKDLLNKLNKKSDKKWDFNELKSITKGYSVKDLNDSKKTESLIKKVADAAGINLSDKKLDKVKKEVNKKLGK